MTEASMPMLDSRASHESTGSWRKHRVDFVNAVTLQHLHLGLEVIDGEPKRIKLNRDSIDSSEFTNRD
jgi:hypothetical protein